MVDRVVENAGQSVVVGLWNGIVLVVVAARACDGQAEEASGNDVDAIVTFIGSRDFNGAVVVVPRTETEEARSRSRLVADGFIHHVARDLRPHELVIGHVVVKGLNDPVAVQVCIGVIVAALVRSGLETAIVVFSKTRHVEPDASPALAILLRGE